MRKSRSPQKASNLTTRGNFNELVAFDFSCVFVLFVAIFGLIADVGRAGRFVVILPAA
jgi:hypothetical protein